MVDISHDTKNSRDNLDFMFSSLFVPGFHRYDVHQLSKWFDNHLEYCLPARLRLMHVICQAPIDQNRKVLP